MFCTKCGSQNANGERFCNKCGCLLENNQPQQPVNNMNAQQPMNNYQQPMNNYQQPMNQQYTSNNGNLNPNYVNQAVNPNMKKWAIFSIIIPIIGFLWFLFIGIPIWIAVALAATGFSFAEKGKMASKKLSTTGKVLNGIFVGFIIVAYILTVIGNIMG